MAIPFLQPEEDDSARQQHGTGPNGVGHAGAGAGSSAGSASGSVVGAAGAIGGGVAVAGGVGSAMMVVGATGPLPIPNSPAPIAMGSGTSTAVQTPLIGPMNGDQLVQLFYEALYRYSRGDTPSTPISQSPQSSSCSPFTTGYYNSGGGGVGSAGFTSTGTGQVFFPQTPNGVYRPSPGGGGIGSYGTTGVFFGQPPTPSPSGSSSHSSPHSANSAETPSCSSAAPIFHQFPSSYQLPSTANASTTTHNWTQHGPSGHDGDESSESDSSQPSSLSDGEGIVAPLVTGCSPHCLGLPGTHHHPYHLLDAGSSSTSTSSSSSSTMVPMGGCIPPHLDYMAGREQLQEFAGKIPQRKKKSSSSSSSSSKSSSKSKKSKFLEQTLVWPTLAVTALIALGCGLLAVR